MKPTECCAKCRFWQKGGSQMGNCRRYPPGFHAVWESFPKISGNGWCGEFRAKKAELKKKSYEWHENT